MVSEEDKNQLPYKGDSSDLADALCQNQVY